MAITKSQKRLIFVLLIAVGYALFDLVSNSDQYGALFDSIFSSKKSSETIDKPKEKTTIKKAVQDTIKDVGIDWGRDPFFTEAMRPPPKKRIIRKKPEVKLTLNAITFSGQNSIVIINNQILKEGQMIEGYLVEKIYLNKVKLSKPGKVKYLSSE